jgi:Zn-dependent M32 family carboxypeptidase
VATETWAPEPSPVMADRSAALLSELQAVCQRILSNDTRGPAGAGLVTMASAANGTALANSLEALRRQCVDNHEQVAELKRSVDGHRGVVAGDSAANGKMLVELRRSVEALTEVSAQDRSQRQAQSAELQRCVEALRVGLAGFSANNRQQTAELRGSLESLEATVTGFGEQVQHALNVLGDQIQTALGTLGQQVAIALRATTDQMGQEMSRQNDAYRGMVTEVKQELTDMTGQVGEEMTRQRTAYEDLLGELTPRHTKERLDELEAMLSVGLPKFSEEIQAGVQQTLMEVSRTFRLAEREHGNRMAELHRDFDASTRRLEAAMQPRRREETVS